MYKLYESIFYMLPPGKSIRRLIYSYPRREKVADLGCGAGASSYYLSSIAGRVVGIDIDGDKVKAAGKLHAGIEFYCMDASRTDFSDGEFDTAFMIMMLHEAYSDRLIAEACRIAGEVAVIDYSRILYGLAGKLIRAIEGDRFESYAGVNLKLKFSEHGFSLRESRSIYSNFFIHVFTRGKLNKTNVVNLS